MEWILGWCNLYFGHHCRKRKKTVYDYCRCPDASFSLDIKWGRRDAENCTYGIFPNGAMEADAMFDYFRRSFNMTEPEVRLCFIEK